MKRTKALIIASAASIAACCLMGSAAQADTLQWSGNVDNVATIYLHGKDVRVTADKQGVSDTNSDVRGFLGPGRHWVRLRGVRGRGSVRIVQQPNRRNGFTAAVRIVDPKGGRGHYSFLLNW